MYECKTKKAQKACKTNKTSMITIDELRKLNGQAHYMGLGVIKYNFGDDWSAYHFYSDQIPILVDDIHDHRYSFTSTIKKGILKTYIYDIHPVDQYTDHKFVGRLCSPESQPEVIHENINLIETANFTTIEGNSYSIDYRTLHRVELVTKHVITYIHDKSPMEQKMPHFITDKRNEEVCAFSHRMNKKQCWDLIEYILED